MIMRGEVLVGIEIFFVSLTLVHKASLLVYLKKTFYSIKKRHKNTKVKKLTQRGQRVWEGR